MDKSDFEQLVTNDSDFCGITGLGGYIKLVFAFDHIDGSNSITYKSETKDLYTQKNLEMIKKDLPDQIEAIKADYKIWLESPQGQRALLEKKVKEFAVDTAIKHDEHGIYQAQDNKYIAVLDVIHIPEKMKECFASGEFLGLVRIDRERPYSKSYRNQFGTGNRSDKYLIGQNETGTKFAHQVSDKVKCIEEALDWIWNGEKIIARHGDIAIAAAKTIKHKEGSKVENFRITDSHVFSGCFAKNGALYVRDGIIHHEKDQQPDVIVPNDQWYKVVFGRRSTKGMTGTKD